MAADALPPPAVTPSAARPAAATRDWKGRPARRLPARGRRVNVRKRIRAAARPSVFDGADMIMAFYAGGPPIGPFLAQF